MSIVTMSQLLRIVIDVEISVDHHTKIPTIKVGEIVTVTWETSSNLIQTVLFKTGNFVNMAAQTKLLQQLSSIFHEEQQSAISLGQAIFFKSHFVWQ